MTNEKTTASERVNADLVSLLKSRHTLIWVVTRDERRVEMALAEVAAQARLQLNVWDCATGLYDASGKVVEQITDPGAILAKVRQTSARRVYALRDFHSWVKDPFVLRALRTLARDLSATTLDTQRAVVVITPSADVPPELAGHAVVIDYPLPDRAEMGALLDDIAQAQPAMAPDADLREAAIDAAIGLSAEEAANTFARSLVVAKRIDPKLIAGEKKRVIAREKVLTWHDADPRGLDAIAGLDVAKSWSLARRVAFTAAARDYGLPPPKGVLLVGQSGCGKSLFAKCVATAFGMPLLRLDMGALRSKYVGESEANIRRALATAEAMSPCVLWLDEIEKALKGATGEQGDGGVAADAFGTILTWMQERKGGAFIVATANDISGLPPEFLRKGRFDEIFFVDLPTQRERAEVLRVAMQQHGRSMADVSAIEVAKATKGFTGAEVANIVPDAMFTAFADGAREVTTADLTAAARGIVPLSETAKEKVEDLRKWAKTRARMASSSEEVVEAGRGPRALDLA